MKNKTLEEKVINILEDLRDITVNQNMAYDTKDEWMEKFKKIVENENKICGLNNDYSKFNSYEKMLFYKRTANRLHIDCDVSLRTMIIYALAFPHVLEDGRKLKSYDTYKYSFTNGKTFDYRGDTMNSFKQITDCYFSFCEDELGKADNDSFKQFVELNHTIGNFIPVPFKGIDRNNSLSFNVKRNSTVGDYWDLTMDKIWKWYLNNDDKYLYELVGRDVELKQMVEDWLSIFGKGNKGWKNFIDRNYLGDFVDEDYKPIPFWDNHLEKVVPDNLEKCNCFFKKVSRAIESRGIDIAEAVEEKLLNMTNEEVLELLGIDKN